MFTQEERDEIIAKYDQGVSEIVGNTQYVDIDPRELLTDVDKIKDYVRDTAINAVLSKIPVGSPKPYYQVRVSVSELVAQEESYVLSINLSDTKASPIEFTFRYSESNENVNVETIIEFLSNSFRSILHTSMVQENLDALNELLGEAVNPENSDLGYTISFVPSSAVTTKFVDRITDTELVLVANDDSSFQVPNLVVFTRLDEDSEMYETELERKNNSVDAFLKSFEGLERPVDFLQAKPSILKLLTSITTHAPATLITRAYRNKVSPALLNRRTDADIFVQTQDGEGIDVIGAVRRSGETGGFTVILEPIYRKTLEASPEVDIEAEIKKQLAV